MNLDHSSHIYSLIAGGCTPEELKLVLISSDESKYNALEKIRRQYLAVMRGHEDESAIIKSCDQLINVLNSLMIVAQERKYNRQNELYIFLKRKVHLFDTFSHENEQLRNQLLIFYNRAFSAAFQAYSTLFQCRFKSNAKALSHKSLSQKQTKRN